MWRVIEINTNVFVLIMYIFKVSGQNLNTSIYDFQEKEINRHKQLQNLISHIMEEMRFRNRCMVLITDSYYENIVNIGYVRAIQYFPMYKLFIFDNEILSPMRLKVRSTLFESQKDGCNSYVILMSNGIQVKTFLQYAERERLIDTRGFFLLMHDFRILRPNMNYLWNRILNVIFLRKYRIAYHKLGSLAIREWFSLETPYFPVQVFTFILTESINVWYNGHFMYKGSHFIMKTSNLQNQKIRVSVFEHFPAVAKDAISIYENENATKIKKALGIEFELILYIARAMNFRPVFYKPLNIQTEKWGVENNGSYNGLLGEAIEGKATFYLGDFYNTLEHHRLLDLSQPYHTECLTFLTPELLSDTSWKLLILPFRLFTWITVIFTLILGSAIIYFFALFYKNYISYNKSIYLNTKRQAPFEASSTDFRDHKSEIQESLREENKGLYLFTEAQNSALYIYSMLLQVSLPMLPRAWAVRVFIGWWWMYSILIAVAYRASMTATLANPIEKKTIDTMAELAKSSIGVGSWIHETKSIFQKSDDSNVQKIGSKFEFINNETEAINLVANGQFAYYENIYLLQQARVTRQLLEAENQELSAKENESAVSDRNLHVMRECLIYMPISLGMDKNSALKLQVDHLIRNAIEVGLIEKWLSDIMEWLKIVEKKHENEPMKALVNFRKLQGALVALAVGYISGLLVLVGEILYWKYVVLKNPAYDKYNLQEFYASKTLIKI